MKKIPILFSLLLALPFMLLAQKGTISGKVIDKSNGEGLIGVTVKAESPTANTGAVTDIEGNYLISALPGDYTVSFLYSSYKTEKVTVTVEAGKVAYLNLTMEEATNTLTEVVITTTIEKTTALSLLTQRKNAPQVSDGVSADLIRRTPDRTTSDVLKRVTGASIQEGKFAVIRGMNDRYIAGYLDGALLPSTESDRKAFAFDVVPANLIDNLVIIKAGSPDLVGDFGGGVIKINTKSVPEKFTQSISIGEQTHSLTTFKGFTQYKRYPGEALNIFGSQRDLPTFDENALKSASTFPGAEEKRKFAEISQKFNNDWSNKVVNAIPNPRISYSLGFPIDLHHDRKLGVVLALNYSNSQRYSEGLVNSFDGTGQTSNFKDDVYKQNYSSGGILNVNYVGTKTQINFRNLLNLNTDNNTIVRTGIGSTQDQVEVKAVSNVINYNRLYNGIVSLKQIVGANLFTINASANYSNVRRNIPDYRIASYTKTPDFETFQLQRGDFFNSSTGRFTSDLKEGIYGGELQASKELNTSKVKTEIKAGVYTQTRNRTFESRNFVYQGNQPSNLTYNPQIDLAASNINANLLYLLEKTSNDLAYYKGKSTQNAFYLMADQKFFEKLRTVYGVRYENVDIHVTNQKLNSEVSRIKQDVLLPSANISYALTEKTNIRGAYYATVNRPEFRELAPFAFFVFDKNAEIRGNTDLKIAKLNNFDLRYEFYPSGSQVISAGAFYKTIKNPVEFGIDIAQPFTTFTYQNEKAATIYGLELEFRKNLSFLGRAPFLNDIVVFSNLALIHSKLQFESGSFAKQNRPLQGQSPYVLNAGIQYENSDNGWFSSIVFNRIGRRIAFVGVDAKYGATRQDVYEAPRSVVDFQFGKNIKRFNLKLTLGDILKQKQTFYQDIDNSGKYETKDLLMFQFKNGFTTSLTVGYTF
ncbi:MAG: TonB-dependent receptor [Bacteroidota bacterium]